jgi:hypothetical protein
MTNRELFSTNVQNGQRTFIHSSLVCLIRDDSLDITIRFKRSVSFIYYNCRIMIRDVIGTK